MYRKTPLVEGEMYHVFNRGVEKRDIFMSDSDYLRFLHSMNEFNSTEPAENIYYKNEKVNSYEVSPRKDNNKNSQLVEILAFTLLPNHFHLLLRQSTENGISEFMQKIGTGYTMYFNKKYKRVGALFQGIFKSSHIDRAEYAMYIPHYIHLNILDVLMPGWKDIELVLSESLLSQMSNYRWSSLGDYLGNKRYDAMLAMSAVAELMTSHTGKEYRDSLSEALLGDTRPQILELFLRGETS